MCLLQYICTPGRMTVDSPWYETPGDRLPWGLRPREIDPRVISVQFSSGFATSDRLTCQGLQPRGNFEKF